MSICHFIERNFKPKSFMEVQYFVEMPNLMNEESCLKLRPMYDFKIFSTAVLTLNFDLGYFDANVFFSL